MVVFVGGCGRVVHTLPLGGQLLAQRRPLRSVSVQRFGKMLHNLSTCALGIASQHCAAVHLVECPTVGNLALTKAPDVLKRIEIT